MIALPGCGEEGPPASGGTDTEGGSGSGGGECEPGPSWVGQWLGTFQNDWTAQGVLNLTDPHPDGNDISTNALSGHVQCGWSGGLLAHHCFSTPIHAIHLHTGELLLYHGDQDERVVKIDHDFGLPEVDPATGRPEPGQVAWAPLPFFHDNPVTQSFERPNLFCSGHAQLADGSIFVASGDITGGPVGGGLFDTFRFVPPDFDPTVVEQWDGTVSEPCAGEPGMCCGNFGRPNAWGLEPGTGSLPWTNPQPNLVHDRWYPTLTTLGDGRVLIAGGYSRQQSVPPGGSQCVGLPEDDCLGPECEWDLDRCFDRAEPSEILEIYTPWDRTIEPLNGFANPLSFPPAVTNGGVPEYPFMFLLPNGDVLYAGGENVDNLEATDGFVLVPPEKTPSGSWAWAPDNIPSTISGASAVMYAPGKILKTGGRSEFQNNANAPSELRTNTTEFLDLSDNPGGLDGYAASAFVLGPAMVYGRHYHNLVLLPNGNVVAVGGNAGGNSRTTAVDGTDDFRNPCLVGGPSVVDANGATNNCPSSQPDQPAGATTCVMDQACADGCASMCIDYELGTDPGPMGGTEPIHLVCEPNTGTVDPNETFRECAFYRSISCCAGRDQHSCGDVQGCTWTGSGCQDTLAFGSCGAAADAAQCGTLPGCQWSGSACLGSFTELCGAAGDEPACLAIPGCSWDDEDSGNEFCWGTAASDTDRCALATGTAASCVAGRCQSAQACSTDADCPPVMPLPTGECLLEDPRLHPGMCSPHNNECYATKTAEIYDPEACSWSLQGEQRNPRMYHSTALLLPNGEVLSMGNGHRNAGFIGMTEYPIAERFAPDYSPNGTETGPTLEIQDAILHPNTEDDRFYLPWTEDLDDDPLTPPDRGRLRVHTTGVVTGFTLVRLGSTTHGFDQDQRLVPLEADWIAEEDGVTMWDVLAPPSNPAFNQLPHNVAPPGFYMLFALAEGGTPSRARYVQLGDSPTVSYLCRADPVAIDPVVTSCLAEPVGGSCAGPDQSATPAALPLAADAIGVDVPGWRVLMPPGVYGTDDETHHVQAACEAVCEAFFAADPSRTGACDAAGSLMPELVALNERPALALTLPSSLHGGDPGAPLSCDVTRDCWTRFDEELVSTPPWRVSPAREPLGHGEEYRLSLAGSEASISCGTQSPVTIALDGEAGLSEATDGSLPHAVYLGSFDLASTAPLTLDLACDDGTTDSVTFDALALSITQPAFGARGVDDRVVFGPGSLVFEARATVAGLDLVALRPNGVELEITGTAPDLEVSPLRLPFAFPCSSGASAQVRIVLDVDVEAALGRPPTASLSLPSSVACGTSVSLAGTFGDPDGDLDDVAWFIDDVRIDPSVSSVLVTEAHTFRAAARDARGATTTATAQVGCT